MNSTTSTACAALWLPETLMMFPPPMRRASLAARLDDANEFSTSLRGALATKQSSLLFQVWIASLALAMTIMANSPPNPLPAQCLLGITGDALVAVRQRDQFV